jgi:hypothetical protein
MATLLSRNIIESGEISLHVPERGPVYYKVRSFHNLPSYHTLATDLLSSGLDWWWESAREANDESYDNHTLPERRHATPLAGDTLNDFLADWEERNGDGLGRTLTLFGFDGQMGTSEESFDPQRLHEAIDTFSHGSPLRIIVSQEFDNPFQAILIQRHPPEVVRVFLANWGLHSGTKVKVHRQKGEVSAHSFTIQS